jgi:DNA polymerase III epsilon subunit-like protein
MKILVFDTETTGKIDKYADLSETEKQPYIVQFSSVMYDTDKNDVFIYDDIIKIPQHIVIPQECIQIHGITQEKCQSDGNLLYDVLRNFHVKVKQADYIIGHNLEFDVKMLIVELYRLKEESGHDEAYDQMIDYFEKGKQFNSKCFCTMKNTVDICKLENPNSSPNNKKKGYKYPKLSELHKHLFSYEPKNLHNSLFDVIITLRCFYKLIFEKDLREINRAIRRILRET